MNALLFTAAVILIIVIYIIYFYGNKIVDSAKNIINKILGTTPPIDEDEIFLQERQSYIIKKEKKIASYKSLVNQLRQIPVDDDVLKHLNTLGIIDYKGDTISTDDVNKAYRKIAQKYHPDKNGNSDAFYAITKAKDSLLNKVDNIMIMELQNHIEFLEESNRSIKEGIEQFTILCDQIKAFNSKQIQSSIKAMDEKEPTNNNPSEDSEEKTNSFQ